MRDLQEVNETSQLSMGKAEEKVRRLIQENKELKSRALTVNDLQVQHVGIVQMFSSHEVKRSLSKHYVLSSYGSGLHYGLISFDYI